MQLLSRAKTFQERLKNGAKLDIRMKLGKVYTSEYVRKYMKYVIIILKRLVSIFVLQSCSNEKKRWFIPLLAFQLFPGFLAAVVVWEKVVGEGVI